MAIKTAASKMLAAVVRYHLLMGAGGAQGDVMGTLSLTKEARIYNGLKTSSLTSGAGKSAQPLVKE